MPLSLLHGLGMNLDRISIYCFAACYTLAFVLELGELLRPGRPLRWLRRALAAAGLVAHTAYIASNAMPLQGGHSVVMLLSLILAVYHPSGTFHYQRTAWGLFVLPVILLLVALARWQPQSLAPIVPPPEQGQQIWVWLHLVFLLFGQVGLCVAFMASLMYLVKWSQLRRKSVLGASVPMPNLERLETIHRRAVNLAFPLFTCGLLIGFLLMLQTGSMRWSDSKLVTAGLLWIVFALLMLVRYLLHVRGRWVALLTILAFGFLLAALVLPWFWPSAHPTAGGVP